MEDVGIISVFYHEGGDPVAVLIAKWMELTEWYLILRNTFTLYLTYICMA